MDFSHLADCPGLYQFDDLTVVLSCVNLDAHLRGNASFARRQSDFACFPYVVRQRLFAEDVLPMFQAPASSPLHACVRRC